MQFKSVLFKGQLCVFYKFTMENCETTHILFGLLSKSLDYYQNIFSFLKTANLENKL